MRSIERWPSNQVVGGSNPSGRAFKPSSDYDGALGFGKNAWLVQVYGENLTDTRAELYANHTEFYKAVTVSRPRTIGLRFSYKFVGR